MSSSRKSSNPPSTRTPTASASAKSMPAHGQTRQIVCGAKNYNVGDKVPLALPGAVLPGDFKIKVGKLRGVESQGMMCSAKELGLGEGHEGLLILPPDAPVGAPLSELFPADVILDLEITPNRPDLLSHYGIAREIAALSAVPLPQPPRGLSLQPISLQLPSAPAPASPSTPRASARSTPPAASAA